MLITKQSLKWCRRGYTVQEYKLTIVAGRGPGVFLKLERLRVGAQMPSWIFEAHFETPEGKRFARTFTVSFTEAKTAEEASKVVRAKIADFLRSQPGLRLLSVLGPVESTHRLYFKAARYVTPEGELVTAAREVRRTFSLVTSPLAALKLALMLLATSAEMVSMKSEHGALEIHVKSSPQLFTELVRAEREVEREAELAKEHAQKIVEQLAKSFSRLYRELKTLTHKLAQATTKSELRTIGEKLYELGVITGHHRLSEIGKALREGKVEDVKALVQELAKLAEEFRKYTTEHVSKMLSMGVKWSDIFRMFAEVAPEREREILLKAAEQPEVNVEYLKRVRLTKMLEELPITEWMVEGLLQKGMAKTLVELLRYLAEKAELKAPEVAEKMARYVTGLVEMALIGAEPPEALKHIAEALGLSYKTPGNVLHALNELAEVFERVGASPSTVQLLRMSIQRAKEAYLRYLEEKEKQKRTQAVTA